MRTADEDEKTRPQHPSARDGADATIVQDRPSLAVPLDPLPPVPREIGGLRILGVLGSGGMGVVYEAEQANPKRRVALKVVRGGRFVDDHYLRMFRREIDTLGRLTHPNIASIYEAGCTQEGEHFFTMELVSGTDLRTYVKGSLGGDCPTREQLRERLRIFVTIAEAVQYAHQRGVIHRDLKPMNILVGEPGTASQSGSGSQALGIKILDFGLARITDSDVAQTRVSGMGEVIGTLAYMSPEQARGDDANIDVRSDVYSMGVLLYELVMDQHPYETGKGSFVDSLKAICEEPPRPMSRTLSGGARIEEDLRTIVGKALEKEPDVRYASAAALAEDLRRYLSQQPILAHPPSMAYQVRKLVARHRLLFLAAAGVAVLLVAVAVTILVQAGRVRRERDRAEQEAARAMAINAFLQETLGAADPWHRGGARGVTLLDALKQAQSKVSKSFANQPAVEAQVLEAIARTYKGLGQFTDAEALLRSAIRLRKAVDPRSDETATALSLLSDVAASLDHHDEGEALAREALAIRTTLHGAESLEAAASLNDVAGALVGKGQFAEAGRLAEESLAMRTRLKGRRSKEVADSLRTLDVIVSAQEQVDKHEKLAVERLSILRELLGPSNPDVALALNDLAVARMESGNLESAEKLFLEAVAIDRAVFGESHPDLATTLENLGNVRYKTGRYDEVLESLQSVLAMRRQVFGDDSQPVGRTMANLAVVTTSKGDFAGAEPLYAGAADRLGRSLGPEHLDLGHVLLGQARNLLKLGRPDEAEPIIRRALAIRQKAIGEDTDAVADARLLLGRILTARKVYQEADDEIRLADESYRRRHGAVHAGAQNVAKARFELYRAWGKKAEADALEKDLAPKP